MVVVVPACLRTVTLLIHSPTHLLTANRIGKVIAMEVEVEWTYLSCPQHATMFHWNIMFSSPPTQLYTLVPSTLSLTMLPANDDDDDDDAVCVDGRVVVLGADKNERVYFNLGMLAMDDKNIEEAENWFKRAVHLKQDFRSALFNLALLLADDDRPLEAAPFLNQLVKYHPDHIKGLILLGDIYINNIKDLDAAENVIEFYHHHITGCGSLSLVLLFYSVHVVPLSMMYILKSSSPVPVVFHLLLLHKSFSTFHLPHIACPLYLSLSCPCPCHRHPL